MNTVTLTSAWEAIILNFSLVFTQPTAHIFINLITGWILCTTRRTITGIMPFAEPKGNRPHDAYHRLFPKSRWLPAQIWKLLAQMLIELFYPAGTVCGWIWTIPSFTAPVERSMAPDGGEMRSARPPPLWFTAGD